MAEKRRAARVRERIFEDLSVAIGGLSDPRVAGVTVTRVEVPDDLQLATVYVTVPQGADKKQVLRGLEAAKGKLRSGVGGALGLRYTPELRFREDDGMDATTRVEALLREIADEKKSRGE